MVCQNRQKMLSKVMLYCQHFYLCNVQILALRFDSQRQDWFFCLAVLDCRSPMWVVYLSFPTRRVGRVIKRRSVSTGEIVCWRLWVEGILCWDVSNLVCQRILASLMDSFYFAHPIHILAFYFTHTYTYVISYHGLFKVWLVDPSFKHFPSQLNLHNKFYHE